MNAKQPVPSRRERVFLALGVLSGSAVAALAFSFPVAGEPEPEKPPVPDTAANVGKCIQGHRVLWHETRAQAAEACLAALERDGEQALSQTWHNFETEIGNW